MKIYISADHRGYELKEIIVPWLVQKNYEVVDLGNDRFDISDDYPDFAFKVALKVTQNCQAGDKTCRGIVICGSGVGVNMAANKVLGARASTAISSEEVRHARQHDDLNILAISADYTAEDIVKEMIETFLVTEFSGEQRHQRRLQKIANYEQGKGI